MKRLLPPFLVLLICSGPALASNRHVPSQYGTIQAAVDASVYGDVVIIAAGTYDDCIHPANPPDTTKAVVVMKSGVALRGEGTGATFIDARDRGRGIHCDGVIDATIEEITVQGAFAANHGAGIYCFNGSSPTIRNCVVRDNNDGGIIVRTNSHPVIRNVTMFHNFGKEGGGLFIEGGCNPVVSSCFVDDNSAPIGGGLSIKSAAPQFLDCLIIGNSISGIGGGSGGGFYVKAATLTMTNCYVQDNVSSGGGGGLYLEETTATINQCTIMGNTTTGTLGPGGGILAEFNSDVTLNDCLIARNSVIGTDTFPLLSDGGGVRASGAVGLTIRRCTIAANSAAGGLGGGVSTTGCFPIIEQSIIASNSLGAGLYCEDAPSGAFTVSCTDIYGNAGGNLICGTDAGGNFNLNPLFCNLATNHFYLQPASPCLPGAHPGGPTACGGNRIGALGGGGGCAPLDVTGAETGLSLETRPNPFRGFTEIRFDVPRAGRVGVAVYDAAGRELRNLLDEAMTAGPHAVAWDGADATGRRVPSGVYFYRLSVDGRTEGRRVIVTR